MSEAVLLAGLRAHEPQAFEDLVRTQAGRLLRVARRFLRDEEDARDAVQEAFVSAFRSIDRFGGGSSLATWLHRIVVNACLMKLRTKRRHPEESLEELLPKFADDGHQVPRSERWPAEPELEKAEVRELVRNSIERLPESYRTVLLLRDIEELSTEETAQQLGISAGAVKVRLHRARQALRALLDPQLRGVA
jgi:RNA polymerase sigma-70 factor (ECF subfamily)